MTRVEGGGLVRKPRYTRMPLSMKGATITKAPTDRTCRRRQEPSLVGDPEILYSPVIATNSIPFSTLMHHYASCLAGDEEGSRRVKPLAASTPRDMSVDVAATPGKRSLWNLLKSHIAFVNLRGLARDVSKIRLELLSIPEMTGMLSIPRGTRKVPVAVASPATTLRSRPPDKGQAIHVLPNPRNLVISEPLWLYRSWM